MERLDLPVKLGKYEIRAVLGHGAMGVVYRAYDPRIDRIVALKAVEKMGLDQEKRDDVLARFMGEARAAGRLMHPNVVGVFEFDEDEDVAFIAMEFIDGVDLKTYIKQQRGRLPLDRIRSILKQLLAALEYSHTQGVVHRDVKPANVFMMHDGTVKLGDFGIAKLALEATSMTRVGTIMGTPNYMSPEQFGGAEPDGRSDLFSVGVMLYELLTGKKPFTGDVPTTLNQILNHLPTLPSRLNPTLPSGLDAVVQKAMAKDRALRFGTAAEFASALEEAFSTESRMRQAVPGVELTALAGRSSPGEKASPESPAASSQTGDSEASKAERSSNRKAATLAVSPWGSADYRTIGEALRHAQPYDRILVEPGTYDESLFIDKPLAIIGKGSAEAIVLCSSTSHCLKIASDGVSIRNLTLRGMVSGTARPAVSIGRGNALFEDCDISSRSRLCVSVRGRNAAPHFRDCRIHDSQGVGVHFAMNSAGKLSNCSLFGHSKAAVRVDKGANPEIVGGSVREAIMRPRSAGSSGRTSRGRHAEAVNGLFADAASDALQGGVRGGLIALAAGLLLVVFGTDSAVSLVGIGVGLVLGFSKARLSGLLVGCLAALVFLPVTLPESLTGMLLSQLGQIGLPAAGVILKTLDLVLKGSVIGALTLVLCGAYLHLMEGAGKR